MGTVLGKLVRDYQSPEAARRATRGGRSVAWPGPRPRMRRAPRRAVRGDLPVSRHPAEGRRVIRRASQGAARIRQDHARVRRPRIGSRIPGLDCRYQGGLLESKPRAEARHRASRNRACQDDLRRGRHQRRPGAAGRDDWHRLRPEQRRDDRGGGRRDHGQLAAQGRRVHAHRQAHAADRAAERRGGHGAQCASGC